MNSDCLDVNSSSATYKACDLAQVSGGGGGGGRCVCFTSISYLPHMYNGDNNCAR